ncbi:MAG: sulfite exporter TauE/SafE family protein [Acidiferrobacterales bacterium]|nr:sulfite exporter TauE/SafE family protein [Acidiferrobacterales bacterium]
MGYIFLLTAVCAVTYTFEIVFGLAGTIMMLMVMTFFFDAKLLVIYSVLPQILVAVIGLYRSPRTVDPREWLMMSGFALAGGLVGITVFYHFPSDGFRYLLASVITLTGVYLVMSPKRFAITPRLGRGLDLLGGMSQGLVGISGPIVLTRLLGTYDNKTLVRNYALAFYLTLNLGRLSVYLASGTIGNDILNMMLISGPILFVVLWFSNHLHFKTNEALFRKVVSWVILFGGISLFFH